MEEYRNKQKAQRPLVFLQQKFLKETGEKLPRWVVKNLIKKYGFQRVIDHIKEFDFSDAKNPIGCLTAAIKNNWKALRRPEYLEKYKVEKKEQLREAENLRLDRSKTYGREYYENERRRELRSQAELIKRKS